MKIIKIMQYFILLLIPFTFVSCGKQQNENNSSGEVLNRILKNKVLRVGTDFVGTPFAFYDNKTETGFEVELVNGVAKELGVQVQWVKIPFGIDTFQKEFNNGNVDIVIESISYTADRNPRFEFSMPYFNSGQAVVLRQEEIVPDVFDLNLLKNKKVGVEKGTTGAIFARNNTQADVIEYESSSEAIDALLKGDVYAIISDILSTQTSGWPLWKKLKIVLKNLTHEEYCIITKKGETGLIDKINETLKKLKEDPIEGAYAKLYRKWLY